MERKFDFLKSTEDNYLRYTTSTCVEFAELVNITILMKNGWSPYKMWDLELIGHSSHSWLIWYPQETHITLKLTCVKKCCSVFIYQSSYFRMHLKRFSHYTQSQSRFSILKEMGIQIRRFSSL